MSSQTHVVLVGGGYVSVWTARALRRWARRRVDVTIVTPDPAHSFHGWTGEILAGDLPLQAGWTPLSEAASEARIVPGRVEQVDRCTKTVLVRRTDGELRVLSYDHLVIGCGTADRTDSVPGLTERAHTVRGTADVQRLLCHVDRLVMGRRPEHAATPAIVVVGGGLAGGELAGALARRVGRGLVTLVQRSEHLGADLTADHPVLARRLTADLEAAGVVVRTGSPLARVQSDRVVLDDGSTLPADVVVAACGTRVRPLPGLEDLPSDPVGRLVTDDRLRIADAIWAGGDAACVPFVRGGSCPASALWAITHGTRIGRSIARVTRGRSPGRYRFRGTGRAASLRRGRGYVELRGIPMTGWVAWLVRLVFFLRYAPSGRQGLRVARWWLLVWTRDAHVPIPVEHERGRRAAHVRLDCERQQVGASSEPWTNAGRSA